MDEVARSQGVPRWALYDPDNVDHMERLKTSIPNALFLHIIRDGRDIALSLKKWGASVPALGPQRNQKPGGDRLILGVDDPQRARAWKPVSF